MCEAIKRRRTASRSPPHPALSPEDGGEGKKNERRSIRCDSNRQQPIRNSRSDLACDIAVSYNVRMKTYRIVEFRRDGLVGWTVESSAPDAKRKPRLLYTTSDRAQAEADRLTAIEAAAGDPAATAKLAS